MDKTVKLSLSISLDSTAMIKEAESWFENNVGNFEDEGDFEDCLLEWVDSNIGRFVEYKVVEG